MSSVQFGTIGGTVCSVWNSFDWSNMIHSALLAAIGATVSYVVSSLLDRGQLRRRRRR